MTKPRLFILFLVVLGILLLLFSLPQYPSFSFSSNEEVRAAIDIGSGATNLKVAKVDPKTNKITELLFEKSIPVAYQKHLEQSSDNTLDSEVMNQGTRAVNTLKKLADGYHAKKVVAVATAAFRKASNAQAFAKQIEEVTGVSVRIINQDEEGILAFRGALAVTRFKPEQIVTWDIGGGSMQLTTLSPEGTYLVEKGATASIPFKNEVIQEIKHGDLKTIQSPNPMTLEQIQAGIALSAKNAQSTPPFIKTKIQTSHQTIIGVGSLFNYAIRPLIHGSLVQPDALEKAIKEMANKTDEQLPGGALAEVAVTNPLLVLGYMKELGIPQVEIVQVNNADGALTYPPYWE